MLSRSIELNGISKRISWITDNIRTIVFPAPI